MPTAENAKLEYEGGQSSTAMAALTDSGDRTTFTSGATLWSRRSGNAPIIRPNGLLTGGAITVATAAGADDVDVAALTCNLNGVVTSVSSAADVEITRPSTAVAKVNSITVNASGSVVVVAGADGSDSTFSETRGANGGPPFIPVDSIEIGQVRVTSDTAAAIVASEIFTVPGLHVEQAINPGFTINYNGGSVSFLAALPAVHTGGVAKKVYASYASPIFAEVSLATDFVPAETSHTTNSQQIYGRVLGSSTATLNAGSFTAYLEDGVADPLVTLKNEQLWFRFYPDRFASPYVLVQGKLGVARSFPADDNITAECTISAESDSVEVA
jgi:hypothetical protein